MPRQVIIEICEDAEAETRAIARNGSAILSFNMKDITVCDTFRSKGNVRESKDSVGSAANGIRVLVFRVG